MDQRLPGPPRPSRAPCSGAIAATASSAASDATSEIFGSPALTRRQRHRFSQRRSERKKAGPRQEVAGERGVEPTRRIPPAPAAGPDQPGNPRARARARSRRRRSAAALGGTMQQRGRARPSPSPSPRSRQAKPMRQRAGRGPAAPRGSESGSRSIVAALSARSSQHRRSARARPQGDRARRLIAEGADCHAAWLGRQTTTPRTTSDHSAAKRARQ